MANIVNVPTGTKIRPVKKGGYSNAYLHAKRKAKRDDANERNQICANLPLKERVAIVEKRRGNSARELARLEQLLPAKSNPPAPASAVSVPDAVPAPKVTKAKRAKKS